MDQEENNVYVSSESNECYDPTENGNLYQNLLNRNQHTMLIKNGCTFIYQKTDEDSIGTEEDGQHLAQETNYDESIMYEIVNVNTWLDSNEKDITVLSDNIENPLAIDNANIEAILTGEDTCDTDVINSINTEIETSMILTGTQNNELQQFAILKDGKIYLQSDSGPLEIVDDNQVNNTPLHIIRDDYINESVMLQVDGNNEEYDEESNSYFMSEVNESEDNMQPFYFIKNRIYRERGRRQKLNQKSHKNSHNERNTSKAKRNRKQKLIGKIIDIRKGTEFIDSANDSATRTAIFNVKLNDEHHSSADVCDETGDVQNVTLDGSNVESLFIDGDGKILKVITTKSTNELSVLSKDDFEYVSKTLSGLMSMISLQKKLLSKTLYVKLVEKEANVTTERNTKVLGYIKGFIMREADENYKFIELADDVDYGIKNVIERTKKNYEESITISKMINASGLVSTRVVVLKNSKANQRKSLKPNETADYDAQLRRLNYCEICSLQFDSSDEIEQHQSTHYSFSIMLPNRASMETHDEIGTIELDDKALREFIRIEGNANDYDGTQLLQQQQVLQSLQQRQMFHCRSCNKTFSNLKDLNSHFVMHNTVKTYVCDVCSREFTRYANLIRHLDIHKGNGDKFVCNICGCAYNYSASLTRHIVQNHI